MQAHIISEKQNSIHKMKKIRERKMMVGCEREKGWGWRLVGQNLKLCYYFPQSQDSKADQGKEKGGGGREGGSKNFGAHKVIVLVPLSNFTAQRG